MADIRNFPKYKPLRKKNKIDFDSTKLFLSLKKEEEALPEFDLSTAKPEEITQRAKEAGLPFAEMLEEKRKTGKIEKIVLSGIGGFDEDDLEKGILGAKILLLIFSQRGILVVLDKADRDGITLIREKFGDDGTVERALMPSLFPLENRRILSGVLFPASDPESVLVISFSEAVCLYECFAESKRYTGHKMRFVSGRNYIDLFVPDGFRISDMLTAASKIFSRTIFSCKEGISSFGSFLPERLPVDSSISSLSFFPYEENFSEGKCIGCGICRDVCPVDCKPDLCMAFGEKAPLKEIEKCVLCGLCNEKCPAGIDISANIGAIREGSDKS